MRKLIALAAAAALFALPAYAAPVWAPSQGGTVGPNVACTNVNGDAIRCIQPSVTLNDATGAAIGTSGNPLVTSPGTGTTGDINVKQVNGATVNVGVGAAGTGTQRVTTSTDSTIGTLTTLTGGGVASGATDSGNPVKVGAKYNTTPPTLTDGQRGDLQIGNLGSLSTQICGQNSATCAATDGSISDGAAFSSALRTSNVLRMFNGATYDRAFTCASSAVVNVTAGATTQIVGLSGTTVIRVCSVALSMSAAGTAGVYTGTGTNCGTGTTALIQDMTLATGTPLALAAAQGGSIVRSSAGGELCVKAVTGNVTGVITYAQF